MQLVQLWASSDIPVEQRSALLEAGLTHESAVVRGYGIRQLARAVWRGEMPGGMKAILARHGEVEDLEPLKELAGLVARGIPGEEVPQGKLEAARGPLCEGEGSPGGGG